MHLRPDCPTYERSVKYSGDLPSPLYFRFVLSRFAFSLDAGPFPISDPLPFPPRDSAMT